MTTPREIIAHPADIIAQAIRLFYRTEGAGGVGEIAVANLTAAGIHLMTETDLSARDDAVLALERSILAIDDWLHQYAPEFCGENYVSETYERLSQAGGTLAYIAEVQEQNRAALSALKGGKP